MKGSNVLKKQLVLCSLAAATLLQAGNESYLSKDRQEQFKLKEQKAEHDGDYLQKSWINPINLSYDKTFNETADTDTKTELVSINQPIFKSGGILYAIKYANATREMSLLEIESAKRDLIAQAITLIFNYNKTKYQIRKQKLLIENNRIDIKRKKDQYLSGLIDSSDLDRALLEKNANTMQLLSLQESLSDIKTSFKTISDMEIESAQPPTLAMVSPEEYTEQNVDYLAVQSTMMTKDYTANMSWAQYLPQLALHGKYQEVDDVDSKYYGVTVSMPLNINMYDDIQRNRLDYLSSAVDVKNKKRELRQEYKNIIEKIDIVKQKLALTKEDTAFYENLLRQTKDQVYVGNQTQYDLETMRNSLQIKRLDSQIYTIDKELLMLDLYIKTYKG